MGDTSGCVQTGSSSNLSISRASVSLPESVMPPCIRTDCSPLRNSMPAMSTFFPQTVISDCIMFHSLALR